MNLFLISPSPKFKNAYQEMIEESSKTIIANGGIFENELTDDSLNTFKRYWITLSN